MGTSADPTDPDYEEGDECEECAVDVFYDKTPLYLNCKLEGVTNCPGFPLPDLDQSFILKQNPAFACGYLASGHRDGFFWEISLGLDGAGPVIFSSITIWRDGTPVFHGTSGITCCLNYSNDYTCDGFQPWIEGTCAITFGPEIDEAAYDNQWD